MLSFTSSNQPPKTFSKAKCHYYVNDPFEDDSSESQGTDTSNKSEALTKNIALDPVPSQVRTRLMRYCTKTK